MSKIPTIAMIPTGYKVNKLYSVLPTNGDADLGFSRSSTANRVNEQGLIEEMGANVPRLDYTDGGCPTLLLEPSSTNLYTHSEDFSNAGWNKSNSSVTSNVVLAPDNTLTADKLIENTANSTHYVGRGFTPSSSPATVSVFAKAADRDHITVYFTGPGSRCIASFNLNDGTIRDSIIFGDFAGATFKTTSYANGWYRCEVTLPEGNIANAGLPYFMVDDGVTALTSDGVVYTGDGTSGVYIWGAQIEDKDYSTSYIPTAGTVITRSVDNCSKIGLQNYIGQSEGVLFANMAALFDVDASRRITISDGTSDNRIFMEYTSSSNEFNCSVVVNNIGLFSFSTTITTTDFNKFALAYQSGNTSLYINGAKVGATNTTLYSFTNTLNTISFDNGTGSNVFSGKLKDLRVYNQILSNTELQNLTS